MKTTSKKLVIHQPNKKYLLEKSVLEMKDQNDNQTEGIKEEPFLVEQNVAGAPQEQARRVVYCSDGVIELDENGNPVEIAKVREKRSVMSSVVKHRSWNVFDSIDSPILTSAGNLGSAVSRKTISAIDYVGSVFASLIGITGKTRSECKLDRFSYQNSGLTVNLTRLRSSQVLNTRTKSHRPTTRTRRESGVRR